MKGHGSFLSWQELCTKTYEDPVFLINPYVPKGGIVLLWGKSSIGKSPLVWTMARAVGYGRNFYGLPTTLGKVLFIELDTPERLVAERLQKLPTWAPPEGGGVDFLFLNPLSVPVLSPKDMAILNTAAENDYDLVIINTLRKTHALNDKESQTPAMVYGFYQRTFPGATLLFVHHSKKSQLNQTSGTYEAGLEGESFSGAQNWINDAQVGIHLREFKNPRANTGLILRHEKSQVSAKYAPLGLRLESDGSTMRCPEGEALEVTRRILSEIPSNAPQTLSVERIASELGIGMTKARELILASSEAVWLKRRGDSSPITEEID